MLQDPTLSFGPFQFNLQSGRLTKHGHRIKLQPKVAAMLCCLLDERGKVVSRAQLQTRLWPQGTYVDFDLGIKVAVKKLRDALGDESEEPRYIQTVPGEGYQFIAPAELVATANPSIVAESAGTQSADSVVPDRKSRRISIATRRRILWGSTAAAVAVAAILGFYPRATHPVSVDFRSRDWVLIAAFENRTGEEVLDGTLEYALERALSESSYVNVIPRERINDTLTLMRQSPSAVLTEDVARQVAIRDGGIKAVVAGRVEKFDRKYVLTVRLLLPASGETAAVFASEASRDRLPTVTRSISDDLRRKLGEVGVDGSRLEKATTPSLAALRAFTLAMEFLNSGENSQAAALLEEAIKEDPQFASAHIYAAHCYFNLGQDDKAAPHFQAAFRLASGVTQRERLFILGSYYQLFLHDQGQAMAAYQTLASLYPDDFWGVNNLLFVYGDLNMFREMLETGERQVALRPNGNSLFMLDLLWYYYRFDRPDKIKAQQYGDKLRRRQDGGALPRWRSAVLASQLDLEVAMDEWNRGDVKSAARQVARVSDYAMSHGEDRYKYWIALANLTLGRLSVTKRLCGRVTDPGPRADCFLRVAYARGDRDLAHRQFSELRRVNHGGGLGNGVSDIPLFLWLGEIATAREWSKRPQGEQESHTSHGLVLLAEGHLPEAAKELLAGSTTPLFPNFHAPVFWNHYGLALVLERQRKLEEAIAELESLPNPDPDLRTGWAWPYGRLELAALYRKTGRPDDALKVEDGLRHYLSEADPDFPLLARLRTGRNSN